MNRNVIQAGFNIIELMFALALFGVLMAVGVPAYQNMLDRNRLASEINDIVAYLNYARSEAVTRGGTVTLCSSSNATAATPTCSGSSNWSRGWILFADDDGDGALDAGEAVLKRHSGFASGDPLTASVSRVSYNRLGFPSVAGGTRFKLCSAQAATLGPRVVQIENGGRVRLLTSAEAAAANVTCP